MNNQIFKYCFLTGCSILFLSTACDKSHLDLQPHGPTEETYYTTEGEFSKGVLGVYAKLSDFYGFVTASGNTGDGSMLMPIYFLPGDDLTTNSSGEEFEQFGPLQPSSGRVNDFYKACYQLIARANVMIEKIDGELGVYSTPGLKETNKGELYFMRGFAYYYLWNYFGTSPLNLARVTEAGQFNPPSTTGTQLLDQAITDFQQSASLLPATPWDETNRGRVTRNAANGFLGKCLVFRGSVTNDAADYTAGITAFNAISGVSLVPQFDDNFAFDTENNAESLFEYQASQSSGNNIWLNNDFDNAIGNLSIAWNFFDGRELYSASRFFLTEKAADLFDAEDPRRGLTFNETDRTVSKYVSRDESSLGWQNASVNNYRELRYADVLLLKAEAILGSGGSASEAIGLINQVRARARAMANNGTAPADLNTAETSAITIFQWIMDERMRELAAEGQRWPDLRRWQMGGKITLTNEFFDSNTNTMSFSLPKHLNLPIPTSETDVNPNVKQNEGY